jgi:hypothetical protein
MLIRIAAEVPDAVLSAFPWLVPVHQPAHTALVGPVMDQEELQGVLQQLSDLGIALVEVVTIPDGTDPGG